MKPIENNDVEFKELDRIKKTVPDSIIKSVIAFANTEGGEIYIGISDDGNVIGVDDTDDVMTQVSSKLRDTILPDIIPFIQIRAIEIEERYVIKVTVSVGTERPYYLAREGLKPKGVFVRVGAACIPVNEAGIREMIIDTSGKSYEESRSMNQDLTFHTFADEMEKRSLELGKTQMATLKMIGSDGLYTNLALLLSDQCPFSIKAAIFQGTDNAVFRERREFTGSILKQLNDAYDFIDFYNKTEAVFNKLIREDKRDYPEEAVREALLNCIVHRDYLFSGSTIINMYSDHMEFISLGGLLRGLSMEAIFMGASQTRNPNLAAVFFRMKLVESYGTGVRKIKRLYLNSSKEPVFQTAEGAFTVTLANQNELSHDTTSITNHKDLKISMADKVFGYVEEHRSVTRKEIEEEFGIGSTKAYNILKKLCGEGKVIQIIQGKNTVYSVQ